MDIDKLLKQQFSSVNKAFFEKEYNSDFLRVEVNTRDLEKITQLSKEISLFLDENDFTDKEYFLDIFSPGTDEEIDPKDSKELIGEIVEVTLNESIKGKDAFIGEVLSYENSEILIRWNAKGQFRKQPINIDNIKLLKKYAKLKKDKGTNNGI